MSWLRFLSFLTLQVLFLGIVFINVAISDEIDLSGTWTLTEISDGCGDKKIDNFKAEITQIGNSIKISIIEGNRNTTGEIINNEIQFEDIREIIPTEGSLSKGIYEYKEYKLRICENANILIGKTKWSFRTSNISCDGIVKRIYIRN